MGKCTGSNAVTVDAIAGLWDNYTREYLMKLFGGRTSLTPTEIVALNIPTTAKLLILLCGKVFPEKALHQLACDFAKHALTGERQAKREPDRRLWKAVAAKRLWIRGGISDRGLINAHQETAGVWLGDRTEFRVAAARAAARAAVAAAALTTGKEAAVEAAMAASYAAACNGGLRVAGKKEDEWQLKRAIESTTAP